MTSDSEVPSQLERRSPIREENSWKKEPYRTNFNIVWEIEKSVTNLKTFYLGK